MTGARAVIAAAVVLLGVSACSGEDPEPIVAPSESTSPSAPTTPTPTAEVSERDEQAALLDEFVGELSAAITTGDPDGFLALAAANCQNCKVLAENLEDAYADGGHIEGGQWTLADLAYQGDEPLGSIWNLDVQSAKERWFDGSGELVKIVRAGVQKFGIALEHQGEAWQVREMRFRDS